MSDEAKAIIARMLRELSSCKYGYKGIVEGCFSACVENYGLARPPEDKDEIVDRVIAILNT